MGNLDGISNPFLHIYVDYIMLLIPCNHLPIILLRYKTTDHRYILFGIELK